MRYSLNKIEHRNFKARITERLVEKYIEEITIPRLKKEGYDSAFFDRMLRDLLPIPLDFIKTLGLGALEDEQLKEAYDEFLNSHPHAKSHPIYRSLMDFKQAVKGEAERNYCKVIETYLSKGVFPSYPELYGRTYELLALLQVATDGLIFRLKKTGKTIPKNSEPITEIFQKRKYWSVGGIRPAKEDDLPDNIPIVSGNIEIVEVKADKASIPPHQRENYRLVLEHGYPLRYFHVFIISFENNQFEVEERSLENVDDLKETIRLFRKVGRDRKLLSHR